jgi:uncharacterized lipoprotein YajG
MMNGEPFEEALELSRGVVDDEVAVFRSSRPHCRPPAQLAMAMAAISCLMGCAFGDRKVPLQYTSTTTEKVAHGTKVSVVTFPDSRKKPEVGAVRNTFGMVTAKVLPDGKDVGEWVTDALCEELRRSGYEVIRSSRSEESVSNMVITGNVLEAFADLYVVINTTLRVVVTTTKAEGAPQTKHYVGRFKPASFAATENDYDKALNGALRDLMSQLLPDLVAAIGH